MTDEGEGMSATTSDAGPSASPELNPARATAGALLKQARQSRGLHIAALAVQLKVPQSKLEALEADRHEDLPDVTFTRALAKAMCRVLKVEAEPILALLPRGSDKSLEGVSLGLNQPFRERSLQDEKSGLELLQRPVVWAPVLLLLAALLIYLLPESWTRLHREEVKPAETVAELPLPPVAASEAASAVEAPAVLAASAPQLAAVPASSPAVASAPAALPISLPVAAAPTPQTPPPAAATPAPGSVPLALHARAESWVEVIDARGQMQLSRVLRAGEQLTLDVLLPAQVRVGNVAGTELTLRGSAVDLQSRAKDNIARLELN